MVGQYPIEAPAGVLRARPEDILAVAQQQAKQVRADEAARTKHEDGPTQVLDPIAKGVAETFGRPVERVVSQWTLRFLLISAKTVGASRPHSRRWKACEP